MAECGVKVSLTHTYAHTRTHIHTYIRTRMYTEIMHIQNTKRTKYIFRKMKSKIVSFLYILTAYILKKI